MEYFELLDETGKKLGRVKEREAVHRDGDIHGASHVWVVRQSEKGAEVLLQKRRPDKDSFPGCLDTSCAGHMTEGETFLSTALRELSEELGLSAGPEDLIYITRCFVAGEHVFHGRPFRNREVFSVYLLRPGFPLDGLTGQKEEIAALLWLPVEQVRREIEAGSPDYCIDAGEFAVLCDYLQDGGKILEVCVDSVESAVNAKNGGADRLELCADLPVGGVTPSAALFERVKEKTGLPVHVLLRPRFGDFLYDADEFAILKRQAAFFRQAGADALVIGCLTPEGRLDEGQMGELMEIAGGLPATLHRAFDMCRDLEEALEQAKRLGVRTILTSGGFASALDGAKVLARLQQMAGPVRLMAGAGINAAAIGRLRGETGIRCYHMSGKRRKESRMKYRNPRVNMGLPGLSEYEIWMTDAEEVRRAGLALRSEGEL